MVLIQLVDVLAALFIELPLFEFDPLVDLALDIWGIGRGLARAYRLQQERDKSRLGQVDATGATTDQTEKRID